MNQPEYTARHFSRRDGWFKVWRKVFGNDLWVNWPDSWFRVWFALLGNAQYEPSSKTIGSECILLPPGSVVLGTEEFAAFCKIHRQQVRSALVGLQSAGMITTKATTHGTIVTFCNWDTYQENTVDDNQQDNHGDNQRRNQHNNQVDNHSIRSKEEENKETAINNRPRRTSRVSGMSDEQQRWFVDFLNLHPKPHIQTASATKLWAEKVKTQECFDFLMGRLRVECAGDTTYMYGPGKWLADHLALYANGIRASKPEPQRLMFK